MQEKRIRYLDSLGNQGLMYTSTVKKYIVDAWKDNHNTAFPEDDKWSIQDDGNNVPQQQNGHDCGVFVCMFAHLLSFNLDLNIDQHHIDQFRDRIAISILRKDAM